MTTDDAAHFDPAQMKAANGTLVNGPDGLSLRPDQPPGLGPGLASRRWPLTAPTVGHVVAWTTREGP